ncbi:MAG: peptidylprolyl isomerase, partial [Bacteroidota bacterium]
MKNTLLIFALLALMLSTGYAQKKKKPSKVDSLVTLSTKFGDIQLLLFEETPRHRSNFLKLAKEGFYDNLLFHRVMKGFMIQGGDPESRNASKDQRLGSGGLPY